MILLNNVILAICVLAFVVGCSAKKNKLEGEWVCVKRELSSGDTIDFEGEAYRPDMNLRFIDDTHIEVEQVHKKTKLEYVANDSLVSFGVLKFKYLLVSSDTLVLYELNENDRKIELLFSELLFIRTFKRIDNEHPTDFN